jgi:hypothetical protein
MGSSNTRPEAKPQLKTFQFSPETSAPIVRSLRDAPVYYDDMEPLLGQRDQMDQNPPVVSEPNAETDSVSNSFDSPVSARIGWIDRQLVLAPTQTLLSLRHNLTKLGETFNGVWYHFGFTMAQIAGELRYYSHLQ